MTRIRTIKPEFWSSPDTAACKDPWARLLFVAMWNWADDEGRGTANPKELAGFAFPWDDDIDSGRIHGMLREVSRAFGVVLYTVRGRPYYAIPSWKNHQRINKPSPAKHPAPEEGEAWDPEGSDQQEHEDSRTFPVAVTEDSGSTPGTLQVVSGSGSRKKELGSRKKDSSSPAPRVTDNDDPDFTKFWDVYPRKVGKGEARKAWFKLVKTGVDAADIIAGAERYRDDPKRQRSGIEYTKHPGPWLNAERWTDQPETMQAQQSQTSLAWWEN